MQVSKEFLRVYDHTFNHIFKEYGLDALIRYWKAIAPILLHDLQQLATKKGIKGCYEYWDRVLTEEGAGFRMKIIGNKLHLEMTKCPSIHYLVPLQCPEYCRHCSVMYPLVLEKAGLDYEWKRKGQGRCEIVVSKREETKDEPSRRRGPSKADKGRD